MPCIWHNYGVHTGQIHFQMHKLQAPEATFSSEIARRLSLLLSERGTPPHQQASLLTQICGLSSSQARRKLQGANWSFHEVMVVAHYCGASLDTLFPVSDTPSDLLIEPSMTQWLSVDIQIGDFRGSGEARLGAMIRGPAPKNSLLAGKQPDGWLVVCAGAEQPCAGELFLVDELTIRQRKSIARRIAIIDDDRPLATSLAEWFTEAGFAAMAFTSARELQDHGLNRFDGFIMDYLLDSGSSEGIIEIIRREMPGAPIMLLTGKLRDGTVAEAELMALLRTSDVTFFEKPVRPGVLVAALQNKFDLLEKRA